MTSLPLLFDSVSVLFNKVLKNWPTELTAGSRILFSSSSMEILGT